MLLVRNLLRYTNAKKYQNIAWFENYCKNKMAQIVWLTYNYSYRRRHDRIHNFNKTVNLSCVEKHLFFSPLLTVDLIFRVSERLKTRELVLCMLSCETRRRRTKLNSATVDWLSILRRWQKWASPIRAFIKKWSTTNSLTSVSVCRCRGRLSSGAKHFPWIFPSHTFPGHWRT